MPKFEESTQLQHWMFPDERSINTVRENTNREARKRIDKLISEVKTDESGDKKVKPTYLSLLDEQIIIKQYQYKILEICYHFGGIPDNVQATAVIFFKRFYLYHSIMEHEETNILLTCIYVACKVEEFHIGVEKFLERVAQITNQAKIPDESVLNSELVLLRALRFQLVVYHPYRSLFAFKNDVEQIFRVSAEALYASAKEIIRQTLPTDLILLYQPGTIALACMVAAADKHPEIDIQKYLEARFLHEGVDEAQRSILQKCLDDIRNFMSIHLQPVDIKAEAKAMRKLVALRKMIANPAAQLSKMNEDKKDKERQERRRKKLEQRAAQAKAEEDALLSGPRNPPAETTTNNNNSSSSVSVSVIAATRVVTTAATTTTVTPAAARSRAVANAIMTDSTPTPTSSSSFLISKSETPMSSAAKGLSFESPSGISPFLSKTASHVADDCNYGSGSHDNSFDSTVGGGSGGPESDNDTTPLKRFRMDAAFS